MRVYCAGPEVFLSSAGDIFDQKRAACQLLHTEAITPFDADHPHERGSAYLAMSICQENMRLIEECDAVVANITPFRGVHMDPGTSFEIGYALALGKKVACYTHDARLLRERFERAIVQGDVWVDKDGYIIEDFGWSDNLMVEGALMLNRYPMVVCDVPHSERFTRIDGFVAALSQLHKIMDNKST